MLKFTFQMIAPEELCPEAVVSRINERFCRILKQDDFITLCCAILDTKNLSVALARAGHPPPLLCRPAEHTVFKLEPSGPPVGLDHRAVYERSEVGWNPGMSCCFTRTEPLKPFWAKARRRDWKRL
jgi:sigma-B regulation protein RsbU (phosphoserine phosphatase)